MVSFKRTILDFRIEALPGEGLAGRRLAAIHIVGSAFLWHQVRSTCPPARASRGLRTRPLNDLCPLPSPEIQGGEPALPSCGPGAPRAYRLGLCEGLRPGLQASCILCQSPNPGL